MEQAYHVPVMLQECLDGLDINPQGIYVDVTFGGGGHSAEIIKQLDGGHLYGFDQDEDAEKQSKALEGDLFTFVAANFRHLKRFMKSMGISGVDGILADLGISSHQIDTPERGFSFRYDAPLDMRMDDKSDLTAAVVLNTYDEEDLHKLFGMYGEVKNARTLGREIASRRLTKPFERINDLIEVLSKFAPRHREHKYYAQVFQAIRIEVNDELGALKDFLVQSAEVLNPGGRLVVMSYHSLEDRLVKHFIQKGKFSGEVEKDMYGNVLAPLKSVTRKAVKANEEEVALNNRARSARLRVAEKVK